MEQAHLRALAKNTNIAVKSTDLICVCKVAHFGATYNSRMPGVPVNSDTGARANAYTTERSYALSAPQAHVQSRKKIMV